MAKSADMAELPIQDVLMSIRTPLVAGRSPKVSEAFNDNTYTLHSRKLRNGLNFSMWFKCHVYPGLQVCLPINS